MYSRHYNNRTSHRASLDGAVPAKRCNLNKQKKSHYILHKTEAWSWLPFAFYLHHSSVCHFPQLGLSHIRARVRKSNIKDLRYLWDCGIAQLTFLFTLHSNFRQNLSFMTDVSSLKCWLNCECLKSTCLLEVKRDAKTRTPPSKNRLRFLLYRTRRTKTTVIH